MWQEIQSKEAGSSSRPPSPRRDSAIAYYAKENDIYVFGGKSDEATFNDMYKFNLQVREWQIVPQGRNIKKRFGMVYGTKGEYWYIATGQGKKTS